MKFQPSSFPEPGETRFGNVLPRSSDANALAHHFYSVHSLEPVRDRSGAYWAICSDSQSWVAMIGQIGANLAILHKRDGKRELQIKLPE